MDLRAFWRKCRIESVAHTWRPIEWKPPARGGSTQFASPDEYARIRDSMLADGEDEDWVAWALSSDGEA